MPPDRRSPGDSSRSSDGFGGYGVMGGDTTLVDADNEIPGIKPVGGRQFAYIEAADRKDFDRKFAAIGD